MRLYALSVSLLAAITLLACVIASADSNMVSQMKRRLSQDVSETEITELSESKKPTAQDIDNEERAQLTLLSDSQAIVAVAEKAAHSSPKVLGGTSALATTKFALQSQKTSRLRQLLDKVMKISGLLKKFLNFFKNKKTNTVPKLENKPHNAFDTV
ncbi:RxLR-like protein [Plasmopara halstedii]|uniref:Secreted RxLR effector protein RXLR-C301 n=1 Tax=Plasmopara halstedii TaxID=4781 RepID=RLR30_PLAHL|nr:RxLR-like protein [Plasmopara halstedii]A0A0P1A8A0.1 RecName: Full=Secreted RxLR effector protein RXLR-C301; Flags: Precursor [Plasmopara halstedii]CEG36406.1 RxLR-like protein [Plasmopara halstedii]|eukprot:XP_024572775.1 RxLR-like protein [Plasmopara halstedii]